MFQAEDGIRDLVRSRGLGDVYKRQNEFFAIKAANGKFISANKNSLQLSAKSDVISDSETFEIIKP